ncbi:MAG TPA: aldose epimerase family protein [Streptosporangiaceae bacterium]|nr:aldose epimerase family protein [Streptosporangiaceae bacterium]
MRIGAAIGLALAAAGSLGMRYAPAAGSDPCHPTISSRFLGNFSDAPYPGMKPVFQYTLTSCAGMQVRLLTYGAIQQSITVPDRHGNQADVILGFRTLQDYISKASAPPPVGGPYFGETVGRYANRIDEGTFVLKQHGVPHTYTLPINNGVNSLHGGFVGFGNHIWTARVLPSTPGSVGVAMTIVSPNGDEGSAFEPSCHCTGYPGTLTLTVVFTLNNRNQLGMHYHATVAGANTVINVTNHDYFNLAGEASGTVYNQLVQINADKYSPTDTTQIPLPNAAPVAGTPFDFRTPHTIGSRINVDNPQLLIAQGYDHNWVLNQTGPTMDGLRLAAQAWDLRTGRELTVWTDQPGVQFYSGNFLNGTLVGISGHIYRQSDGYTFETQHFPDSPNEPTFPSTELRPGQEFDSTTIYQFSTF